ncbi:MAG: hypothetical protein MI976_28165 [Pseudomonadales bacterium]|nr:hypothetical protein [Pseudomonadales bacterium]
MKKASVVFTLMFTLFGCSEPEAASLKGSDFMKLDEDARIWWYAGAFTAFGHAMEVESGSKEKSQCIWNWYFERPQKRREQLEESFEKYPEHSPTTVIMALVGRDCGVYKK